MVGGWGGKEILYLSHCVCSCARSEAVFVIFPYNLFAFQVLTKIVLCISIKFVSLHFKFCALVLFFSGILTLKDRYVNLTWHFLLLSPAKLKKLKKDKAIYDEDDDEVCTVELCYSLFCSQMIDCLCFVVVVFFVIVLLSFVLFLCFLLFLFKLVLLNSGM